MISSLFNINKDKEFKYKLFFLCEFLDNTFLI